MTKTEKRKWLKAIDELRQHYYRRKRAKNCPLCLLVPCFASWPADCAKCLWMKYEQKTCQLAGTKGGVASLRDEAFYKDCSPAAERWRKDSLKRLNRWEKRIKGMK